MARRQLLTGAERTALLGIPADPDAPARLFTPSRADRALVAERRGDANRLGCAVQLALLRHPGTVFAYLDQPADALVTWMGRRLDIPAAALAEYARRPQTMTDHARQLAAILGLRVPTMADVPPMIEAAAEAARSTDNGRPIATAVIAALRSAHFILPGAAVIERVAIAGRARARKRAAAALVAGLSHDNLARLDGLIAIDASVGLTPFAWLKAMPVAPKADQPSRRRVGSRTPHKGTAWSYTLEFVTERGALPHDHWASNPENYHAPSVSRLCCTSRPSIWTRSRSGLRVCDAGYGPLAWRARLRCVGNQPRLRVP